MAKISDEEFAELKRDKQHQELIKAIRPPDLSRVEALLENNLRALTALLNKKESPIVVQADTPKEIDITPLVKEISNGMVAMTQFKSVEKEQKPSTFRVVRNQHGFIDKIVVE